MPDEAQRQAGDRPGPANLLMLSGDRMAGRGQLGPFHHTLNGLRRYWDRIDVICPGTEGAASQRPFEDVYVHPGTGGRVTQPWFIRQTGRRLMAQRPYALLVSHDFGLFYNALGAQLLLASVPRKARPPLVSEIHHLPGTPRAADKGELASLLLHQLYVRLARRKLAGFRVVNGSVAAQFRKWGVPEQKLKVLSSFYLDHETFHSSPAREATKEWDVVFCARLVPNKAPNLLIEALALVKHVHSAVRCAIVGEGPLRVSMEAQARRLGLAENVTFFGWVPAASDIAALYRNARMLVCTSYNEGGPRVTLEAMACGTPVVTTAVGIMPDVIDHRHTGMLVDWTAESIAREMSWLLSYPDNARIIGVAGQRAVQRFRFEVELDRYAQAYRKLAGLPSIPEGSGLLGRTEEEVPVSVLRLPE